MIVNGYKIEAHADLSDTDLSVANLSGVNLSGADLSVANLSDAKLRGAKLRGANLCYTNLSDAKLSDANLNGADLNGADIRGVIGDRTTIKTLLCTKYHINYTKDVLTIGCQQHTKDEWLKFTDDEISDMDEGALGWWKEWKPKLEMLGVFK